MSAQTKSRWQELPLSPPGRAMVHPADWARRRTRRQLMRSLVPVPVRAQDRGRVRLRTETPRTPASDYINAPNFRVGAFCCLQNQDIVLGIWSCN